MTDSSTLNTRFAIPGHLHFTDSGAGLPVAEITTPDASNRALCDWAFDLELVVTVSSVLKVELITRNTGDQPIAMTEALHTAMQTLAGS
jgi:glucose-6-phosphate 1-epimerase